MDLYPWIIGYFWKLRTINYPEGQIKIPYNGSYTRKESAKLGSSENMIVPTTSYPLSNTDSQAI